MVGEVQTDSANKKLLSGVGVAGNSRLENLFLEISWSLGGNPPGGAAETQCETALLNVYLNQWQAYNQSKKKEREQ